MNKRLSDAAPALVLLILIVGVISGAILTVKSIDQPTIRPLIIVSPETPNVNVGETFTVTIATSGLMGKNLYGFDLLFLWDTIALRYISHEVKVPVENHSEGVLHDPIVEVRNEVNMTVGSFWLAYASVLPAASFNDDGVILAINFELKESSDRPYRLGPAVLADRDGNEIFTTSLQGMGTPVYVPGTHSMDERWVRNWLEWWLTVTRPAGKSSIARQQ